MTTVSDSTTWIVFGVLALFAVVAFGLWWKYLPRIKAYRAKLNALNSINSRYVRVCRERKDLVFHFYWAVDRGDDKEADLYENRVMDIDSKLALLREEYIAVENHGSVVLHQETTGHKSTTKVD
jgi:hypothetical protein